jgi:hypothetical protein
MQMSLTRLLLLSWLATSLTTAQAGSNDVEQAKARMEVVQTLKIGDAEELVHKNLLGCEERDLHSLTNEYVRLCQPLSGQRAAAWLVYTNQGVAQYVIAVFSEKGKLADLLSFVPTSFFRPMVRGTYIQRLESVNVGMNVDHLYQMVGQESPYAYHRPAPSEAWRVILFYWGIGGERWIYTVDAASGRIIGVSHQPGSSP